jgi:hypothetical protein
VFAIMNVAIEILGSFINILLARNSIKTALTDSKTNITPEKMDEYFDEVGNELDQYKPVQDSET